jgi:hypothetical protein
MIQEIKTIDDVKTFFQQLLAEDLNFHPDTPFEDYIHCETRRATYSTDEAEERNRLMDDCFDVCDSVNTDIYEIANEIFPPYPWQM